jgi:hypothetical protein
VGIAEVFVQIGIIHGIAESIKKKEFLIITGKKKNPFFVIRMMQLELIDRKESI